jgi:hypothetical protein
MHAQHKCALDNMQPTNNQNHHKTGRDDLSADTVNKLALYQRRLVGRTQQYAEEYASRAANAWQAALCQLSLRAADKSSLGFIGSQLAADLPPGFFISHLSLTSVITLVSSLLAARHRSGFPMTAHHHPMPSLGCISLPKQGQARGTADPHVTLKTCTQLVLSVLFIGQLPAA